MRVLTKAKANEPLKNTPARYNDLGVVCSSKAYGRGEDKISQLYKLSPELVTSPETVQYSHNAI